MGRETLDSLDSVQSYHPVIVQAQPTHLGQLCLCLWPGGAGRTPGTHVEVYSAATRPVAIAPANLIGTAENTGAWVCP
ncbi:MAG: hypothetical protein M3Z96_14020 [Pseudomonadota bacterium]|nr:hypothetical protein [Pseudomonadota bacterium]